MEAMTVSAKTTLEIRHQIMNIVQDDLEKDIYADTVENFLEKYNFHGRIASRLYLRKNYFNNILTF